MYKLIKRYKISFDFHRHNFGLESDLILWFGNGAIGLEELENLDNDDPFSLFSMSELNEGYNEYTYTPLRGVAVVRSCGQTMD